MADFTLDLELVANQKQIKTSLKKVETLVTKTANKIKSVFSKVGQALSGIFKKLVKAAKVFSVGVVAAFALSVRAFTKQEDAIFRLTAALDNVGDATEEVISNFKDFAASIQETTKFGDEEVLQLLSLQSALGVSTDRLEEATRITIGLAAATGRNVESMGMYVALALQGEFTMLRRYIPALRAATNETEQLRIVQEFATRGFKIAEAEARTLSGRFVQMKNAIGDVAEVIGEAFAPVLGRAADAIRDWAKNNQDRIEEFARRAAEALEKVISFAHSLIAVFQERIESQGFLKTIAELAKNMGEILIRILTPVILGIGELMKNALAGSVPLFTTDLEKATRTLEIFQKAQARRSAKENVEIVKSLVPPAFRLTPPPEEFRITEGLIDNTEIFLNLIDAFEDVAISGLKQERVLKGLIETQQKELDKIFNLSDAYDIEIEKIKQLSLVQDVLAKSSEQLSRTKDIGFTELQIKKRIHFLEELRDKFKTVADDNIQFFEDLKKGVLDTFMAIENMPADAFHPEVFDVMRADIDAFDEAIRQFAAGMDPLTGDVLKLPEFSGLPVTLKQVNEELLKQENILGRIRKQTEKRDSAEKSLIATIEKQKEAIEEIGKEQLKVTIGIDTEKFIVSQDAFNESFLKSTQKQLDIILRIENVTTRERIALIRNWRDENIRSIATVEEASVLVNETIMNLEAARFTRLDSLLMEFRDITTGNIDFISDHFSDFTNGMIDSFAGGISSMILAGDSLADAMRNVARSILKSFIDMSAQIVTRSIFASFIPSLFPVAASAGGTSSAFSSPHGGSSAPSFHSGKAAGFMPKLHNGLRQDEFPAILQFGETVLKKGDSRATPETQPPIINIINNTSTPIQQEQVTTFDEFGRRVTEVVLEDAAFGGKLSRQGAINSI